MTSRTRMNLMLCMVAMVISLVPGQRITSNTKVGASDTKFFLPTSGSSPDLLSGAAGFGLGLAASQIGGNLINSLGNTGGSCCCGRRKRQAEGNPNERFFVIGGSSSSGGYNSRCQCPSQTFYSNGKVQGNCRSRDETGRLWCYTTGWNSGCGDLRSSSRYPNNPWSYNACSNNYG